MKILCDVNNFIIAATTDENNFIPNVGQYVVSISNEYSNLQLYEINFAYPLYKYVNGQIAQITEVSDYYVNVDYLSKVFKKLRTDFNDIVESSVLTEFVDVNTIKLTSGFVGIQNIILSNSVDTTLTFSPTDIDVDVTKKSNTWYYVYAKLDLSQPTRFKGMISETPPTRDRFGNDISGVRDGERYHPTLDARFRGSFKTDNNSNIIPHKRVGNKISYMNASNYVAQGISSSGGTTVNCRDFIPVTSNIGQFVIESVDKFNNNQIQEVGSSEGNYILRIKKGASGASDIALVNDSIAFRTQASNLDISVLGYYEEV